MGVSEPTAQATLNHESHLENSPVRNDNMAIGMKYAGPHTDVVTPVSSDAECIR